MKLSMLVIMRLAMMIAVLLSGAVTGQEVSQTQSLQTETVSDADNVKESTEDGQETIRKFKIAPPKFHSEAVNYFGDTVRIWDSNQDGWEDFWCMIYREIKHRETHPDTDGDGVTDYHEMLLHRDPMVPGPLPRKLTPEEQKAQDVLNEKLRVENLAKQREQWKKNYEARAPFLLVAETRKKRAEFMTEMGKKFLEEDRKNPVFVKPGHDTPQGLAQINHANGSVSISPTGHNLRGVHDFGGYSVVVVEETSPTDHVDIVPFVNRLGSGAPLVEDAHTTAVAGVIASTGGLNAGGRGVAPGVELWSYQINPATSLFARFNAVAGKAISNHSYGPFYGWSGAALIDPQGVYPTYEGNVDVTWDEPNHAGQYRADARAMDVASNLNQSHLYVNVAGNCRATFRPYFPPPPEPHETEKWFYSRNNAGDWVLQKVATAADLPKSAGELEFGYDSLTSYATAKNPICVGAVFSDFTPWTYSSFGPTDDGRIKPDLTALGSFVVAPYAATLYSNNWHGTSFAAPVVSGAAALLHEMVGRYQLQGLLYPEEIKCIMIHTAINNGTGPNYKRGWGNVNIDYAVEVAKDNYSNPARPHVKVFTVQPGQISYIKVRAQGSEGPSFIKATLVWNDLPADVLVGLDNSYDIINPRLVNDLDLYVLKPGQAPNDIQRPWLLNPWQPFLPASTGVDTLNNVEQVEINQAVGGVYTIVVDGTKLTNGPQQVALAFTGNTPEYEETKVLMITDLTQVGEDEWSLGWQARAGETYTIQESENLGDSWNNVATGIEAIGDQGLYVVPSSGDKKFWRVVEE